MELLNIFEVNEKFSRSHLETLNSGELISKFVDQDFSKRSALFQHVIWPYNLNAVPVERRNLDQPCIELTYMFNKFIPKAKIYTFLNGSYNFFTEERVNPLEKISLKEAQDLIKDPAFTWLHNTKDLNGGEHVKQIFPSTFCLNTYFKELDSDIPRSNILLGVEDPLMYLTKHCIRFNLGKNGNGDDMLFMDVGYYINPNCKRYEIEDLTTEMLSDILKSNL